MNKTLVLALAALIAAHPACAGDAQSMFDELSYRALVGDTKARQIGDVLTVIVQEAASASSSADLRTQRRLGFTGEAGTNGAGPYSASAATRTDNDGAGRTQRSGRLLAQISVRVIGVNERGDLQIAGEQSLEINGEEQLITLSGIVRPRDVTADNTVLSSRIADARIRFAGEGFVTDQSKPGLLARIFNFLGL
ncbi:MAG TPA: flagellar basal body L-ring protein FlgH [Steroidobacteraceae bacterium]|nr:flagellar basal body L-ring protein FlgH [Steroidobacteraceae bacterium]